MDCRDFVESIIGASYGAVQIPFAPKNNTKTHERVKKIGEKIFAALKKEGIDSFFASLTIDGEASDMRIVDSKLVIETSRIKRDISEV